MLYRCILSEAPQWGQCGDKRGNWGGTRLIPDCAVRWSAFVLRLCSLLGCTGNGDKIGDKLQELFWNYYKEQKQDRRVRGKVWEGKRDAGEKGAESRISSPRLTFLSSVVFFGQPSLALGAAVQAVIWHRSFAWPFCIPCYLISSTRNKQETRLQGRYMYVNGADDDPVERMASLLDSTTPLLCHGRSFPFAVSMLLVSHSVKRLPSACLEMKSGTCPAQAGRLPLRFCQRWFKRKVGTLLCGRTGKGPSARTEALQ